MIFIGADHGGYALKEKICKHLDSVSKEYNDLGTYSDDAADYPDYARSVCEILQREGGIGILICGTGIGMSIAANKHKGIKAALCWNEYTAKMARQHNDANVLCLGGRVLEPEAAFRIVDVFLSNGFEDAERHIRRVGKVMAIEEECC